MEHVILAVAVIAGLGFLFSSKPKDAGEFVVEPAPSAQQELCQPYERSDRPMVRDLTVPYEARVYILDSGELCHPKE